MNKYKNGNVKIITAETNQYRVRMKGEYIPASGGKGTGVPVEKLSLEGVMDKKLIWGAHSLKECRGRTDCGNPCLSDESWKPIQEKRAGVKER